jgi:hypothetical protein
MVRGALTAELTAGMSVAMKTDSPRTYVLTIDVEIDAGPKWKTSNPASYEGVYNGIEVLQRLCDSLEADRPFVQQLGQCNRSRG